MVNSSDSEGEGAIGFGRKAQDSSSSRESSPARRQKRSFSPTSDDEDLVVPEAPNDDTPPPEDRPLIRQAVAFSAPGGSSSLGFGSSGTTAINTYQASVPAPSSTTSKQTFLPGQSVPPPPKPARKTGKRRPKGTYPEHSGRFRLTDMTPAAPEVVNPPMVNPSPAFPMQTTSAFMTSAPYYQNTPTFPIRASQPSPAPTLATISSDGTFRFSTTPPASATLPAPSSQPNMNFPLPNVVLPAPAGSLPAPKPKAGASKKSGSITGAVQSDMPVQPVPPQTNVLPDPSMQRHEFVPTQNNTPAMKPYYRRDYNDPPPNSSLPPALQPVNPKNRRKLAEKSGKIVPEKDKEKEKEKKAVPRRMLTLLIIDFRSGEEDPQLAEVQVPLRPVDPHFPEDGFWANANDVAEELQNSPSRIDGQAKVFTMRGRYRQFFLRVKQDNSWEVSTANLSVKADRTIDIYVEKPARPGVFPEPPRLPQEYPSTPELELRYPASSSRYNERTDSSSSRKRRASKSPTYSPSPQLSNSKQDPRSPKKAKSIDSEEEDEELFATPLDAHLQQWEYESPDTDEEPEKLNRLIADRIDPLLQTHEKEWEEFFSCKSQPQHVPSMLAQYQFVQKMADKIQMSHILDALHADTRNYPKFGDECTETLKLLAFYGPEGTRKQDPRIKEMMQDRSEPEYGAKPIKRFLHLLRKIDDEWNSEQRKQQDLSMRDSAGEQNTG
ncbi:hypothetical protein VNI00_003982 [Paramarasmius palmivorus]|uniref:Uncharacterized protein n=1 Tax=Paramarasmius palmivorus TaxID=297713 RepID=A0AAW0DQN1_9AGAR